MEFLLIAILATVIIVAALGLLPRKVNAPLPGENGGSVYRDQLLALDRDLAAGSIPAAEADSLRIELSRRLIDASKQSGERQGLPAIPPLLFALFIPLIAAPLYWQFGSPQLADTPRAQRIANAIANNDFEGMLAQVEKHLVEKPDDMAGWKVAASAYARLGRYNEAADAYLKIASLGQPTAEILTSHGEMLILANQGMVSKLAALSIQQALALDPTYPKARFFAAMALKQDGKTDEAKAAYEKLLSDAPPGAPWRKAVESELASLAAPMPALPDAPAMDGMAMGGSAMGGMAMGGMAMDKTSQDTAILSMVNGLEQNLGTNPADLDGWLKLIRARMVLGETDKAKSAMEKAKTQFKDQLDALARISALADETGLK